MNATEINEKLHRLYGREKITGCVKYRVVRSEEQLEKRYGSYKVFTEETGIYLRDEVGVRQIKKYWYMKDCWVLERVEPNTNRAEYIIDKVIYEPLFTFLSGKNEALPLEWRPIELCLYALERVEKKKYDADEDKKKEAEYDKLLEQQAMAILDEPESTNELPTFKASSVMQDTKEKSLVTLT